LVGDGFKKDFVRVVRAIYLNPEFFGFFDQLGELRVFCCKSVHCKAQVERGQAKFLGHAGSIVETGNRLTRVVPETTLFYQSLRWGYLLSDLVGVEGFFAGIAQAHQADGGDHKQAGYDEEFAAIEPIHGGTF
jgi:hypothetical protein